MMRIDVDEWQIRSFRTQDAEALARYANNRNVSRNLRDEFPYPYTLAHAETWISFAAQQFTESDFAIASETELIGGIGLRIQRDVHRRSAEVGYWLGSRSGDEALPRPRCGRSPNTPFRSLICCGCTGTSTSGIPPRPGSWRRPATSARAAYAKVS